MKIAIYAAIITCAIFLGVFLLGFAFKEYPAICAILLVVSSVYVWVYESIKQQEERDKNPREMTSYDL